MSYKDTLVANGFKGKFLLHVMPWMGDGNVHRVSRYNSTDPDVIDKQTDLIKLAGGDGIIVTWLGPSYTSSHQATLQLAAECNKKSLLFALLVNPEVASQANWFHDPGFLSMMNEECYVPEKFLLDFSSGIDYTKVPLPPGTRLLLNQRGFGWQNAYDGNNVQTLTEIQSTNKQLTMMIPFVSFVGHNDGGWPTPTGVKPAAFTGTRDYSKRVWSANETPRVVDHQAGNFFLDTVAALSLCPNAPYAAGVWNDADEGAGIEHFMAGFFNKRLGK